MAWVALIAVLLLAIQAAVTGFACIKLCEIAEDHRLSSMSIQAYMKFIAERMDER